jgi:hypothetical protein
MIMGLFNKKERKEPEERPKTDIHELKKAVIQEETFTKPPTIDELESIPKPPEPPKQVKKEEKKIKIKEEPKSKFAPLFIKIDRYDSVINLLNDLKASLMMVKNAIVVQREIEKLAEENRKLIEDGIDKIDKKLLNLDAEFVRPKGFKEKFEVEKSRSGLDGVVEDLKSQVDSLKSELDTIG